MINTHNYDDELRVYYPSRVIHPFQQIEQVLYIPFSINCTPIDNRQIDDDIMLATIFQMIGNPDNHMSSKYQITFQIKILVISIIKICYLCFTNTTFKYAELLYLIDALIF